MAGTKRIFRVVRKKSGVKNAGLCEKKQIEDKNTKERKNTAGILGQLSKRPYY